MFYPGSPELEEIFKTMKTLREAVGLLQIQLQTLEDRLSALREAPHK